MLLGDALTYVSWAERIAGGDWLGTGPFYQAPLYPYVLAALFAVVGQDLFAVRLFQALAGAIACGLMTAAGQRFFGRRAGVVSGLLLACYAPAIFFDGLIQKSALDLLSFSLLLLAVALLHEDASISRCALAGASLGFLAMTRENALLLGPVLLTWLWLRNRKPYPLVLAFLLGCAAVLAPVAIRNQVVSGEVHLTTVQLGPNFFIGNSDRANGTYVPLKAGRGNPLFEQRDATELAQRALGRTLTPGEVSAYWRYRALEWIGRNPTAWLRLMARKALLFWNRVEAVDTEDLATYGDFSPVLRVLNYFLNFGVLAPIGFLGMFLTRERLRELWILHGLAVTYFVSVAVFYVLARYRYPVVPVLVLFAGAAIEKGASWWKNGSTRERTSAVALVAVTAIFCNWPALPAVKMRGVTHYNVGVRLQQEGRTDEAVREYEEAIRLVPEHANAHSNLGLLLAGRGEHDKAIWHYRNAIHADPDLAEAHTNLGIELAAAGKSDAALAEFERAVELDPESSWAVFNLGTALAQLGDSSRALHWLLLAVRLDPMNATAHNNLGIVLASVGRLQEAIVEFKLALQLQPGDYGAKANLTRAEAMLSPAR